MAEPNVEKIYKLTPVQEGMLYHKLLDEDSTEYIIQSIFQYNGELNIDMVKQSLVLLSLKHEVLRTAFIITKAGNPWQTILRDRQIELNIKRANDGMEIELLKRADLLRGFDLKNDSLLRVSIICKKDEDNIILWTMHHIIADGWCLSLLIGYFLEYYRELLNGEDYNTLRSEVEKEKANMGSYQDYIHILEGRDKEVGLQYWESLLEGYSEVANIAPIQAAKTGNEVEYLNLEIDRELSKKLQAFAQKEKITMNNIAEVAWGIVFQKYNRTNDVVFGKVVSGRDVPIKGIDHIVGLFINTVPIRIQNNQNTTIRDLLQSVHQQGVESSEYDYCPLVDIQSRSELGRNLFSTIFVYENYYVNESTFEATGSHQLGGNIIVQGTREQTNYGISVSAHYSDGLKFTVMYNPRVYGKIEVELILKRIEMVISDISTNPGKRIADIDLVSDLEKETILYQFNNTYADYPREKAIHQLFEEQVDRTPDSVALVYEGKEMTYGELNAKSNQLARILRSKGVKPDGLVGIMVERSFEMIIGILGILKAGGAYLPIDPEYPKGRIEFMLEDSGVDILLTQIWLGSKVVFNGYILELDDSVLYEGTDTNLEPQSSGNNLAYVIYTSGSTGVPKGVMVEHKSLINYCISQINRLKINGFDRAVQTSSITFDMSVEQIFTTILGGASLYLIDKNTLLDRSKFLMFMRNNAITYLHAVPSLLENLDLAGLDYLKRIVSGGELCTASLIKRLVQDKDCEFYNSYGPTETTIISTMYQVKTESIGSIVPIGKPIENFKLFIVSAEQKLSPIGISGELCISGEGLARGYFNRPELTAEKFTENPFLPGERIYRTGDLARWLPDGNIEFLGRIDHQVKIRGLRIELGEIESRLLEIEAVKEAIIIAKEDELGDKYLCAYVVAREELLTKDLRERLRESLPDYMIPSYFVQLTEFPLNPNGKVDRQALPVPEGGLSGIEYVVPRTEEEKVIAGIFSEILGSEKVGAMDDFFLLGGDSIKAIRIISKLREAGYVLSVRDLMKSPTVEQLGRIVRKCEEEMLYEQGEIEGEALLLPIQKWFFESNLPKPNHFNQSIILRTTERVEPDLITSVFDAIVKHHDILRAVYKNGRQYILSYKESARYELREHDYRGSGLKGTELAKNIEAKNNELQASINIETGPLLKVGLHKTEEADHLMVCIHHLVVDGVSWRILMEDIEIGCKQYLAGSEMKFSEKTASYKAWGSALKEYSKSNFIKREIKYWKQVAATIKEGMIEKSDTGKEGLGYISVVLEKEETDKLLYQSNKAFGTEINDLLLSGLGLAVFNLTGQKKLSVNLEGHGREAVHKKIDIDRTVGWFTSVYPVIIGLSDNVKDMIISTKEMLRKIPNKGLDYGVLKYLSEEAFNQEEAQVTFNYLGSIDAETDAHASIFGVSPYGQGIEVAVGNLKKDIITLNCIVAGGKLNVGISYRKDKFRDEDANCLGELYKESLIEVVNTCLKQDKTLKTPSDFGLSDDRVSQALLEEWLEE